MKKLDAGYYEIKPDRNKKPTIHIPQNEADLETYSYTEKYYNSLGEECYEIKIHKGNPVKHAVNILYRTLHRYM